MWSPEKQRSAGSIPTAGLMYRGYDIHEMAEQASFEEVAYLFLNGELPDLEQLGHFQRRDRFAARTCPTPVLEMLRLLPKGTHPMDMVRTGVSMLGAVRSGFERSFARRQYSEGHSPDRAASRP